MFCNEGGKLNVLAMGVAIKWIAKESGKIIKTKKKQGEWKVFRG